MKISQQTREKEKNKKERNQPPLSDRAAGDRVTVKHIHNNSTNCQRLYKCVIKITAWEEQKCAQRDGNNRRESACILAKTKPELLSAC